MEQDRRRPEKLGATEGEEMDLGPESWDASDVEVTAIEEEE